MTPAQRQANYRDRKAIRNRPERAEYLRMLKQAAARGIHVCSEWLGPNGFAQFLKDLGIQPKRARFMCIVGTARRDEKGYCPETCRWVMPYDAPEVRRCIGVENSRMRRSFVTQDLNKRTKVGEGISQEIDYSRNDLSYWYEILSKLNSVDRGKFLVDAPRGQGLLISGEHGSKEMDIIDGYRQFDGEDYKDGKKITFGNSALDWKGGKHIQGGGEDPQRYERGGDDENDESTD
jgi:hypothetical protein